MAQLLRPLLRLLAGLALIAGVALAEAPATSIRPLTRPGPAAEAPAPPAPPANPAAPQTPHPRPRPEAVLAPTAAAPTAPAPAGTLAHPRPRPAGLVAASAAAAKASLARAAADPRVIGPRPRPRPEGLGELVAIAAAAPAPAPAPAAEAPTTKKRKKSRKGAVCGDPDIEGEVLAPITSKTRGCGVAEPVRVTAIDGIRFSQPATLDCETALALKTWIERGMRPAFGNREVVGLHIAASYVCRSRNNVRGAKISEHGRGKAVDVSGFILADGREWTVKSDYNKQIRKAHKAACGIFGTTLGPGSDGYHEDHLHFATASYRSGAYRR